MRAVASCPVPVVSAVGHEQDTPLCDLAADVRASTPTAAGKLVVPDFEALRDELIRARSSLERSARRATERERERLVRTRGALERGARGLLVRDHRRLTALGERLRRGPVLLVERRRGAIERTGGRLTALSPRATLGATAQQEPEQHVEPLERGEAHLDEAIGLCERGEELLRFCLTRLETAEGRIEELAQRAAGSAPLPRDGQSG